MDEEASPSCGTRAVSAVAGCAGANICTTFARNKNKTTTPTITAATTRMFGRPMLVCGVWGVLCGV